MELKKSSRNKFKIMVYSKEYDGDMMPWLEERIGKSGRKNQWRYGWSGADHQFHFKNEQDALMFILRWQ